jgi:hypothetical protein
MEKTSAELTRAVYVRDLAALVNEALRETAQLY